MLHEVLLSLSGIPGVIFKPKDNFGLEVVQNLPYVHSSELAVLTRLCLLGSSCRKFDAFIKEYGVDRCSYNTGSSEQLCGQYLITFSEGLQQVVQPYKRCLLDLEQMILRDPHMTLSHIQHHLQEYFSLFPVLCKVIEEIEDRQLHGGQILEELYERSVSGTPIVKSSLEKILFVCHGLFFKQISCWLLFGRLIDNYQEFFVKSNTSKLVSSIDLQRKKSDTASIKDNDDASGNGTRKSSTTTQSDTESDSPGFGDGFVLSPAMIPNYIPSRLAEKILFVGQSVRIFKDKDDSLSSYDFNHQMDILNDKEFEFSKQLYSVLTESNFSVRYLESEVDKIKSCVTEQLWKLIVEKGKLLRHLKLVKEMYLLGRGELFLDFIEQSQTTIKSMRQGTISYDLNAIYHQSISKLLNDSEEYETLFSVSVEVLENTEDGGSSDWNAIKLNYNVPWPLHIIFTTSAIVKYNALFRFLLNIKRVQISLQKLWAHQMSSKHDTNMAMSRTWNLRRQMAFFIDSFQSYLQVDVLDAQFSILCRKIENTKDFETIQLAHETYLSSLSTHSFLMMKPVHAVLVKLLDVCQMFCDIISHGQTTERERRKVDECATEFERRSSLLFKIISSVQTYQSSPHLAQLLLRIDFNKFFTMNTENTLLADV